MANKIWLDALAYGFVIFTALLVVGLLWLGWEQNRDVARRKKMSPKE
jgi:hypothetical protein